MRILRINDIDVDIDDQTAIGIDFQSYDVTNPGKRFVTISNTFTIPLTANNKSIFGNAQNPQSLSTSVYEDNICNYWVDNEQLIKDAKCRVEEIQDRISLFIFQKKDIWDILKSVEWPDFITDFITWAQLNKGLESAGSPIVGGANFVNKYIATTESVYLPMYFGNLLEYIENATGNPLENSTRILLKFAETVSATNIVSEGGHFCIYAKTIFEYIEDTYDVNFLTSGGVLPGNIWDDPIANAIYIPAKEISISLTGTLPANVSIYFEPIQSNSSGFLPLKDQRDKKDKTLYDFVNAFMQHFNILKDELEVNGEDVIRMARFDDIETADVLDWSGNTSNTPLFKPLIEGYGQKNIIKFKEIYPEGDSLLNSKTLESSNVNLDYSKDLFDIDSYVPGFIDIGNSDFVPDLSIKESFKTFAFLITDGTTTNNIDVEGRDITYGLGVPIGPLHSVQMPKAALYNLDDEYNYLDEAITYPKYYELEKWFKPDELKDFEFFKQYYIRELNGSFFINKISGFNPDKSKEPTTIEIMRISNRTPIVDPDLNYWTDGVADAFTDGDGDYFF
jgi:hypothetical protein